MASEKGGGFLLTDLEASNFFLFVSDVLGKFTACEDYAKWIAPEGNDSMERVMASAIIMNNLANSEALRNYILSLEPADLAKQTMVQASKIVFEQFTGGTIKC